MRGTTLAGGLVMLVILALFASVSVLVATGVKYAGVKKTSITDVLSGRWSTLSQRTEYLYVNQAPFLISNNIMMDKKGMKKIFEESIAENYSALRKIEKWDEENECKQLGGTCKSNCQENEIYKQDKSDACSNDKPKCCVDEKISNIRKMLEAYKKYYRLDLVKGTELETEHTIARSAVENFCGLNAVCEKVEGDVCGSNYRIHIEQWDEDCQQEGKDLGICCADLSKTAFEQKKSLFERSWDNITCGPNQKGFCEQECSYMRSEVSGNCPGNENCCRTEQREDQVTIVRTAEVPIIFRNIVDYLRVSTSDY